MLFEGFDTSFQQIAPFTFIIKIVTPDNNTFLSPPIQCQGMNEAMAYEVFKNPEHRKQFVLEIEVKKEYI